MYEGGLRVPFIVSWPGQLPQGQVCDEVVSSLDLFTTVATLARTQAPNDTEGQNLLPLFSQPGARSRHELLFWRQGGRAALRSGPWKIVAPQSRATRRKWELYHIESDLGETRDLAAERPDQLDELVSQWQRLNQQMAPPLF